MWVHTIVIKKVEDVEQSNNGDSITYSTTSLKVKIKEDPE